MASGTAKASRAQRPRRCTRRMAARRNGCPAEFARMDAFFCLWGGTPGTPAWMPARFARMDAFLLLAATRPVGTMPTECLARCAWPSGPYWPTAGRPGKRSGQGSQAGHTGVSGHSGLGEAGHTGRQRPSRTSAAAKAGRRGIWAAAGRACVVPAAYGPRNLRAWMPFSLSLLPCRSWNHVGVCQNRHHLVQGGVSRDPIEPPVVDSAGGSFPSCLQRLGGAGKLLGRSPNPRQLVS